MKVATLFSGIGAPEVAMPHWDWRWRAEIDPFCNAVAAHHWPNVPNLGDINGIRDAEPVDCIVMGPPCQSFSVAGQRRGLADPRGDMALVALRLVARLRPAWVVIENVPGLLSSSGGRDFGTLLRALAECGYGWAYRILDARYFGLAQRRERVFIVGHLGDWRRAASVLFEPASLRGDTPAGGQAGQEVAGTLGGGSGSRGWANSPDITTFIAASVSTKWRSSPDNGIDTVVVHSLTTRHGVTEDGTGRGTPLTPVAFNNTGQGWWNNAEVASGLRDMSAGGGSREATVVAVSLRGRPGGGTAELTEGAMPALRASQGGGDKGNRGHGVLAFRETAAALTSNYGKQPDNSDTGLGPNLVGHNMAVRRLVPVECERLQGFPDDFTLVPYRGKPAKDGPRYRAIGNSMAVPVVRWILGRIEASSPAPQGAAS